MSLAKVLSDIASRWVRATGEQFTAHPVATLVRTDLVSEVEKILNPIHPDFIVRSSPGAGNWAAVPWVAILNPAITDSTQRGIYPVYLFRADGSGIYLSLGFGTTDMRQKYGLAEAKRKAEQLSHKLRADNELLNTWNTNIDLRTNTILGKSYQWATAGAKFYPIDELPNDDELKNDLVEMLSIYNAISGENDSSSTKACSSSHTFLSKPFLLLAGISGTGKSRFVRKQAEAQGSEREYFQLVPVRPDWHEPSDLLGYVSRIGGKPKFVVTDALRFIVKAWRAINAEALALSNGNIGWWSNTSLDDIRTYWLCLDEMNLAPVEQYFADYLSVIESRCWLSADEVADTGKDYMYQCAAIVSASSLNAVEANERSGLAKELGLYIEQNAMDAQLWNNFLAHGIPIPFNLVVAGTVNMDETTHGFSRKVIDRALTFDFGRFFPNDFNQLWEPETQPKTLQYSRFSHATKDALKGCAADPDGQNSIMFLQSINSILRDTPFELAYRALNELLLAVICHQPTTPAELQAVWDDFLMCKVLPRIEGDDEKLSTGDASNSSTLLDELHGKLSTLFADIWEQPRPDLFREALTDGQSLTVPCRSKEKLQWMKQRLERNSFTSFWP